MKKIILTLVALGVLIAVSGCDNDNVTNISTTTISTTGVIEDTINKYKNLDLSETLVVEHSPESGEWVKLTYEFRNLSASGVLAELERIVKALSPETIFSNDDVMVKSFVETHSGYRQHDTYYEKSTKEELEGIDILRYVGEDLYVEIPPALKYEMYNRDTVYDLLEVVGKDWESDWMWRPYFSGVCHKTIKIAPETDLSESYSLNGENISISEALKFAEETLNEDGITSFMNSDYTAVPNSVDVFKFDETHYGYSFEFLLAHDGVTIDGSHGVGKNGEKGSMCPIMLNFFTFTGNTVDWLWSTPMNSDYTEKDICSEIISYDEACEIISGELSPDFVFEVESAELCYSLKLIGENEAVGCLIPTWRFKVIDLSGFNDFSLLYVYVDAETREVFLNYGVK